MQSLAQERSTRLPPFPSSVEFSGMLCLVNWLKPVFGCFSSIQGSIPEWTQEAGVHHPNISTCLHRSPVRRSAHVSLVSPAHCQMVVTILWNRWWCPRLTLNIIRVLSLPRSRGPHEQIIDPRHVPLFAWI